MNRSMITRFREALVRRHNLLMEWFNSATPAEKALCGCAGKREFSDTLCKIEDAIDKIDNGTFGKCAECDGEVEPERLEQDYTTCVCLDHYSKEQLRTLENELELAAKVQRHLLPSTVPALPGVQIAAHSEPAQIVSGDYFDFFYHSSGAQGLAIADVMGKGVPASMLMSNLQASLRILGPDNVCLGDITTRLNELFRYNLKLIRFITLSLMTIDTESGMLEYCNAGHHPPLYFEAATGAYKWLKPTGPAIGLMHNPAYRTERQPFKPGDVLVLYTDGLVEARDAQNEEFDEERLLQYTRDNAHKNADDFLAGLRTAHNKFANGKLQDDLTLLVVKFA